MTEAVAAATTEAPATNGKPAAGTRELAEFYAKKAVVARNTDVAEAQAGMEAARAEGDTPAETDTAEGDTGRERGKNGQFKPKGKPAAKTAAEPAEAEEATASDAAPAETAGAGDANGAAEGRARKLVREGNIAGALATIGLHPDKLEGKQWGAFRQREKQATEALRLATQREAEVQNLLKQAQQHYGRFDEAIKAYEAGDHDRAFQLWTNGKETPDDFIRGRVHAIHTKTKDPELVKLRKELQAEKDERAREKQEKDQRDAEQGRKQARDNYRTQLATSLAESGDARIAKAATKPAFVQRVFDIQEQHWSNETRSTIDDVEAAELAWEELYEGVAGETSTTTASSVSRSTGTTKTPVRQVAKATTTLNPHEASEASPAHKLKPGSKELRDFYARKAELAAIGHTAGEQDAG